MNDDKSVVLKSCVVVILSKSKTSLMGLENGSLVFFVFGLVTLRIRKPKSLIFSYVKYGLASGLTVSRLI